MGRLIFERLDQIPMTEVAICRSAPWRWSPRPGHYELLPIPAAHLILLFESKPVIAPVISMKGHWKALDSFRVSYCEFCNKLTRTKKPSASSDPRTQRFRPFRALPGRTLIHLFSSFRSTCVQLPGRIETLSFALFRELEARTV
jgi:hypothetical protein